MATRVVEGKKPYTGGKAISIDENKVISLNLRDENNLIIYDEGDDEIYVDLQLPDGIEPTDAFPVGVTTGRAVVADGWDKAGTIISAKTTSGDEIKILYADDGTLWIDNGTGTFKQIYFKADVDAIVQAIWNYIHANVNTKTFYLASDQDLTTAQAIYDWWEAGNNPIIIYNNQSYSLYREVQGVIEFFENTPHAMTIWNDRTALVHHNIGIYEINDQIHLDITLNYSSLGDACFLSTEVNYTTPYTPQYAGSPATKAYVDSHSGDVLVSDQANNIFTPGMKIWGGTEGDFNNLIPDSNTAYLLTAGGPTPGGWQPGVNTKVYYKINDNDTNTTIYDLSGNGVDQTWNGTPGYTTDATYGRVATFDGNSYTQAGSIVNLGSECTLIALVKRASGYTVVAEGANRSDYSSASLIFNRNYDKYTGWYAGAGASDPKLIDSMSTAVSNQWVMIAITRASDGTAKIYVNGVLDNTVAGMNNPDYSSGENLQLGRWRNGDEKYLNGQIKLIIGEDRTWTDQEIADLASEYGF